MYSTLSKDTKLNYFRILEWLHVGLYKLLYQMVR